MAPPQIVNAAINAHSQLANAAASPNRAYITFLAGNGDYVKGVVGLAKGLRKVKSAYPLVVAVLPDVPEDHRRIMANHGCVIREIEAVPLPENVKMQFARPYFAINYNKLRIWEVVEYSKMIYLDADVQVFDNIDHLFDLQDGYFYAVADCLCDMHGEPCPEKIQWPAELGPEPSFYFNAGMFMFEPSLSTYQDLLNTLKVIPSTPFAEQDLLNMFFRDVSKPIPPVYNLLLTMLWRHSESVELEKVKVVHFCAPGSKPWRFTGKEANMDRDDVKILVKKWWDIYNDDDETLHHYKSGGSGTNAAPPEDNKAAESDKIKGSLTEAGDDARYATAPSAA